MSCYVSALLGKKCHQLFSRFISALFSVGFLFICNHWGEEGKGKASEAVLKGQTVHVIGPDEMGLLPATFQMRAAGFLTPSAAYASLCT